MRRKRWVVKEMLPQANSLSVKYGLSPVTVSILLRRKVKEEDFLSFLNPQGKPLIDPFLLPEMHKAVGRIHQACKTGEKVLVCGDYDVDGVTSLAIFHEFSKNYPGKFSFYIPHRVDEGYGLSKEIVKQAQSSQVSLIVAFDCGTNALEEITYAREVGIDVLVIDHHTPKENFNIPFAFVNPKQLDEGNPLYELSSGALAFKFLQALTGKDCSEALDLVALSLVCDVAPLIGENRILLVKGLAAIKKTTRAAIRALCSVSKIKQENIETFHLGYILGPRINAAGRIAHANKSLEVFLTDNQEEAIALALELQEYNKQRKDLETVILKEAEKQLPNEAELESAIVVAGDGWHPGVLGIVASRIMERFYRPTFVISFDQEKQGKGSARSIHNVHLIEILKQCSQHLPSFGGHKKAAGIHILKDDLIPFKEKVNQLIRECVAVDDFVPILEVDGEIYFSEITLKFVEELESLRPFGESNSMPLFLSKAVFKKTAPRKVYNNHSLWLIQNNHVLEAVVYDKDLLEILRFADCFDVVYTISKNSYHNLPRLSIKDLRICNN